jgi:hypothetical protein
MELSSVSINWEKEIIAFNNVREFLYFIKRITPVIQAVKERKSSHIEGIVCFRNSKSCILLRFLITRVSVGRTSTTLVQSARTGK